MNNINMNRNRFFNQGALSNQKRSEEKSLVGSGQELNLNSTFEKEDNPLEEKLEIYIPSRLLSQKESKNLSCNPTGANKLPISNPSTIQSSVIQHNKFLFSPNTNTISNNALNNSINIKQGSIHNNNVHLTNMSQNQPGYPNKQPVDLQFGLFNKTSNNKGILQQHFHQYSQQNSLSKPNRPINNNIKIPNSIGVVSSFTTNSNSLQRVTANQGQTGPTAGSSRKPTPEKGHNNSNNNTNNPGVVNQRAQIHGQSINNQNIYPTFILNNDYILDEKHQFMGFLNENLKTDLHPQQQQTKFYLQHNTNHNLELNFQQFQNHQLPQQQTKEQDSQGTHQFFFNNISNTKKDNSVYYNLKRNMRVKQLQEAYDNKNPSFMVNTPNAQNNNNNNINNNNSNNFPVYNSNSNQNSHQILNDSSNLIYVGGSTNQSYSQEKTQIQKLNNNTPGSIQLKDEQNLKKMNQSFNQNPQNNMEQDEELSNMNSISLLQKSNAFDINQILQQDNSDMGHISILDSSTIASRLDQSSNQTPMNSTSQRAPKNSQSIQQLEKGKVFFKENDFDKALECFKTSLELDSKLVESNYLVGVCYLSQKDYLAAIKEFQSIIQSNLLNKRNVYLLCSVAYQQLDDIDNSIKTAYLYRGQLFIKQQKYDQALNDFEMSIQLCPEQGRGYLGQAESLMCLAQWDQAITYFNKAVQFDSSLQFAMLVRRCICYSQIKDFDSAYKDVDQIFEISPSSSEGYYCKGLIINRDSKNMTDSLLSFQQSIKHNNSKKAVTKSLYEITQIQIDQRDFYEAYHTLTRADFLEIDQKSLEKFRLFTEGVIFLMKRKFKEALENLNNLHKLYGQQLGDFLKPLFYVYRAYGFFCTGKHQSALQDYLAVEKQITENQQQNSLYNQFLCEGLVSIKEGGSIDTALSFLNKAHQIFKTQIEPIFYRAVGLNQWSFTQFSRSETQKLVSGVNQALLQINHALEINDSNSNAYYFRALIRIFLGYIADGINDIEKAIQKSEDNVPQYYFLRGHAYACCKSFKHAINDLTVAINLDENYAAAYLQRAQCYHYIGEANITFTDLQKYISLKPDDPQIHLYAGNLLFSSGAYDDAVQAYSHSDDLQKNFDLLLQRSKCYLMMREYGEALQDMSCIVELKTSRQSIYDKSILNAIQSGIQESQYEEGSTQFIQMFNSTTEGYLFKNYDIIIYAAAFRFYQGKYSDSIDLFKKALDKRKQLIDLEIKNRQSDKQASENASSEDNNEDETQQLSNQLDRTCSVNQIHFNTALCEIMNQNLLSAQDSCARFEGDFTDITYQKFAALSQLLFTQLENQQELPQEECQKFQVNLNALSEKFCRQFPKQTLTFDYSPIPLEACLIFDLPFADPPDMYPAFDVSLLENFNVSDVQNKPQAPWIVRNEEGIVFTDNLQFVESLDLDTQEKQQNNEEETQNQENADYDEIDEDQKQIFPKANENTDKIQKIDFKRLQDDLKLEDSIEKQLEKFFNQQKINQENLVQEIP